MDEKQVKSKVCGINIDKEIKEETVIFLYKTFGMGAVQELPNSYWVENGLIKSKYIVKYLIEKILKYKSRKQVSAFFFNHEIFILFCLGCYVYFLFRT